MDWGELVVDADETFEEGPMHIMDSRDQVLRGKIVRLVKVLWQHRGVEEATWGHEDTMSANYSFLFEKRCMFLAMNIKWLLHMHVIVYGCVWEFQDEILLRGRERKIQEKLIFFEKWKNGKLL